jgi:hypothetical protein
MKVDLDVQPIPEEITQLLDVPQEVGCLRHSLRDGKELARTCAHLLTCRSALRMAADLAASVTGAHTSQRWSSAR